MFLTANVARGADRFFTPPSLFDTCETEILTLGPGSSFISRSSKDPFDHSPVPPYRTPLSVTQLEDSIRFVDPDASPQHQAFWAVAHRVFDAALRSPPALEVTHQTAVIMDRFTGNASAAQLGQSAALLSRWFEQRDELDWDAFFRLTEEPDATLRAVSEAAAKDAETAVIELFKRSDIMLFGVDHGGKANQSTAFLARIMPRLIQAGLGVIAVESDQASSGRLFSAANRLRRIPPNHLHPMDFGTAVNFVSSGYETAMELALTAGVRIQPVDGPMITERDSIAATNVENVYRTHGKTLVVYGGAHVGKNKALDRPKIPILGHRLCSLRPDLHITSVVSSRNYIPTYGDQGNNLELNRQIAPLLIRGPIAFDPNRVAPLGPRFFQSGMWKFRWSDFDLVVVSP